MASTWIFGAIATVMALGGLGMGFFAGVAYVIAADTGAPTAWGDKLIIALMLLLAALVAAAITGSVVPGSSS